MEGNPTYEELARRLSELEQIFKALQSHEVDAIVGSRSVLMLRIKEAEENLRRQREDLETLLEERSTLIEELRTHQIELEEQAEELRQSQDRAREARDRYRDLYDHAPVGYLTMKRDSLIIEANLTAARLLGVSRTQLVNSRLNKMIAPDSQDDFYFHTRRTIETGRDEKCDVMISGKDGKQLYVQLTSVVISSGEREAVIRTTMTDITKRKKVEETLKESEERFRIMADSSPLMIWVHDTDGNIQFVNVAYREFFGVTFEQVKGPSWQPLVHPEDAETYVSKFLISLREHKPFHAEARVRRGDGEWRWVESFGAPRFSGSGEFLGMVGSSPDITQRKKMERKIEELLNRRSVQLQKSQSNFELLVRTMTEGVIVVDGQAHVRFANPAAAAVLNVPEKELIGYRFEVPATPGFSELVLQVDDRTRILELNTARIEWNGEEGHLVTLQDATVRRRALERVRMLSRRLVTAQEKERREIGRELHDELGGALTGIRLALARSEKRLGEKAQSELKKVDSLLDETMNLVSTLSNNMRPGVLYEFGLVEALKWYFERYTRQTGVKICFTQDELDSRCSDVIEMTAYRIVQESLTNVARHAGAKKATVLIRSDSEKLYLHIEDEGCGFDPQESDITSSGISGMQDRALVAGGDLVVDSSPGRGTRVACELPLDIT